MGLFKHTCTQEGRIAALALEAKHQATFIINIGTQLDVVVRQVSQVKWLVTGALAFYLLSEVGLTEVLRGILR